MLDCAVVLAWVLEEHGPDTSLGILERVARHGAIVPAIWPLEVSNSLMMAQRQRRLSVAQMEKAVANVRELRVDWDRRTNDFAWTRILSLAQRHGLSAYDASYLELAARTGLALATYDRPLAKAAENEGILVLAA